MIYRFGDFALDTRIYELHRGADEEAGTGPVGTYIAPLQLSEKPPLAVLLFNNLSDNANYQYFADGITEDHITELNRYPDPMVIARNSSFAYRGGNVDVKAVAANWECAISLRAACGAPATGCAYRRS